MAQFKVVDGLVLHKNKAYNIGDLIELNEQEYNNVKDVVVSVQGEAVQKGDVDIAELTKVELEALVAEKGIEVVGSGKDGAVLKEDLVNALK